MPELAEVEFGRKVAESVALHRRITSVWCADDPIVFEKVPAATWSEALTGARVLAVCRHGKHLWFEMDRTPAPLFHFGMTGAFRVPLAKTLQLASTPKGGEPDREEWPPRFARIELTFEDGGQLAMTNKRRLGRLRLRDDPRHDAPIGRLGFDPLTSMPSDAAFAELIRRRKSVVKGLLLNQAFAAGVGNWLADEILFQAGIAPHRLASSLSQVEAEGVGQAMRAIVARAVSVDADRTRFPEHWLFHRRWGKPTEAETAEGQAIEFVEISGRTTAWVPSRQG
ncbi:MAG: formamidopyrimidine-DNA glycosylase [Myxococcota bacterium]|jgi:formamidopyrimidine-DNA glycosylase